MKKLILIHSVLLVLLFCFSVCSLSAQWSQVGGDIEGIVADDKFGSSVSLSADGTILAVGAPNNDSNGSLSGHVRVYAESGGIWTQLGGDINGESAGDASGFSVALSADGTRLAVGAPFNDITNESNSNTGQVRIYIFNGGIWSLLGEEIYGQSVGDMLGRSVSISADGTRLAIGANYYTQVYEENDGVWTQLGDNIAGEGGQLVVSLSPDGTWLAVGEPFSSGNGVQSGCVKVYSESSGVWSQVGTTIQGEGAGDQSGYSVSLSEEGARLAIGSPGNTFGAGHVRVFLESGGGIL